MSREDVGLAVGAGDAQRRVGPDCVDMHSTAGATPRCMCIVAAQGPELQGRLASDGGP